MLYESFMNENGPDIRQIKETNGILDVTMHYFEVSKGKVCSKYEKIKCLKQRNVFYKLFFIISRHFLIPLLN